MPEGKTIKIVQAAAQPTGYDLTIIALAAESCAQLCYDIDVNVNGEFYTTITPITFNQPLNNEQTTVQNIPMGARVNLSGRSHCCRGDRPGPFPCTDNAGNPVPSCQEAMELNPGNISFYLAPGVSGSSFAMNGPTVVYAVGVSASYP